MRKDVLDDEGNKIGIDHRDEIAEKLHKILFNYPDMQLAFAPLYNEIYHRDLINRNRHKKGDDLAKRVELNESLREKAQAFLFGWDVGFKKITEEKFIEDNNLELNQADRDFLAERSLPSFRFIKYDQTKYWVTQGDKYLQ